MAKGSFSQTLCLLTDGRATLPDIKAALRKHGFDIVQEREAGSSWQFGDASLTVAYRPEVNGYVAVDHVDRPWPDTMGDAKSDATTFAAWSMGHFGPWTFPGGLQRAAQHAWSWAPGRGIEQAHAGFIRIRLSYAFDASADSPVLPEDYDALDELKFVSRLVLAIGESAGILCYFNPNGEVLLDHARFSKTWQACAADDQVPLPLWMNVRLFKLDDALTMMDTVGNSQLDRMDVEAMFPTAEYDAGDVDNYLRNVTLYLLHSNPDFTTGEAIDGPGETDLSWRLELLDDSLASPPRKVLRLYPQRSMDAVADALADLERTEE